MNLNKENLNFWVLKFYNESTKKEEVANIACAKRYKAKDVKRIMGQAHPEYSGMKAKRAKKPDVWKVGS